MRTVEKVRWRLTILEIMEVLVLNHRPKKVSLLGFCVQLFLTIGVEHSQKKNSKNKSDSDLNF